MVCASISLSPVLLLPSAFPNLLLFVTELRVCTDTSNITYYMCPLSSAIYTQDQTVPDTHSPPTHRCPLTRTSHCSSLTFLLHACDDAGTGSQFTHSFRHIFSRQNAVAASKLFISRAHPLSRSSKPCPDEGHARKRDFQWKASIFWVLFSRKVRPSSNRNSPYSVGGGLTFLGSGRCPKSCPKSRYQ
jgi:hypothetical protein